MLRQLHHRYFGKSWGKQEQRRQGQVEAACVAGRNAGKSLVPAVFNVNSLADMLNPPAGAVTLRSAIQAANATPGA